MGTLKTLRIAVVAVGVCAVGLTAAFANDPPVLSAIGDKVVYQQEAPLTFTAEATDPDVPATPLTYGLTDAPVGASIDPVTGQFRWMPMPYQYPAFFTFTVWVQDGGDPMMGDSETIMVETRLGGPTGLPNPKYDCRGYSRGECECKYDGNEEHWCTASGSGSSQTCIGDHLKNCPH